MMVGLLFPKFPGYSSGSGGSLKSSVLESRILYPPRFIFAVAVLPIFIRSLGGSGGFGISGYSI